MLVANTFEQTDVWDPNNPNQVVREYYAYRDPSKGGYGGYQSTYFNKVAPAGTLGGLGLGLAWATMPSWAQVAIVGLSSAAVGYFAMSKWGDSHIKPAFRRITGR